jgi:superfamily II RNA helicase
MDPDRRRRLTERLDEFLEKYPFLRGHPHLKYLYGPGVAAHHAGHLPHWKLVIEQLMQEGLLTAIFSTSTVAAGVNFPARTVVISQSDRFNGREFVDLTATDLLQMTGRAGRRGMDRIGFALFVPGPFMDPMLIHRLFSARPEPVESRIHINFSMTLNLLSSHRPDQIQPLLDRSLAAYQYDRARREDEAREIFDQVEELLTDRACDGPEEAFSLYNTSRRLKLEAKALKRQRPSLVWETALAAGLTPGRLFETTSGQPFVVLERKQRRGRAGVSAAKLREDLGLKKGRVRQKWVPLSGIDTLYDTVLDFSPKDKPGRVVQMVRDAASEEHQPLAKEDLPRDEADSRLADLDRRLDRISQDLDRLPCSDCPAYAHCQGREAREAQRLYHRLLNAEAAGQSAGGMLYSSFLQHMDFLKMEGYITEDGDLTDDGLWAARLRLDHPILIGEGIRADAWPVYDPGLLAAAVAPFVMDREIETDLPPQKAPPSLTQAWLRLETAVAPLKERLQAAGFDSARLYFRPAMAIYAWAEEGDWSRAVDLYGQDPGDMAMLVFRSADNLRQMAGLADTHPELADAARRAVDMILKEPVTIPL